MEGLQRIENAKTAITEGLALLDKHVQLKTEKNRLLGEDSATLEQKLVDLSADFERKKADFDKKISQNGETLEKLLADIEQAGKDLAKALGELKITKRQHKDFMDYRKRANAVLESHEQAIIEKEDKLDTILSTAKRRTNILADL